jgi:hypothetical protein
LNRSDHAAWASASRDRVSSMKASMPQSWPARDFRSRSHAERRNSLPL